MVDGESGDQLNRALRDGLGKRLEQKAAVCVHLVLHLLPTRRPRRPRLALAAHAEPLEQTLQPRELKGGREVCQDGHQMREREDAHEDHDAAPVCPPRVAAHLGALDCEGERKGQLSEQDDAERENEEGVQSVDIELVEYEQVGDLIRGGCDDSERVEYAIDGHHVKAQGSESSAGRAESITARAEHLHHSRG